MWRQITALAIVLGALVLVGLVSGCSEAVVTSEPSESAQMVGSGSWYFKNQWPHDGNPYEAEGFTVYSDAASVQARQRLAEVAEDVLVEIVGEMGIDPGTMFRFPAGQDKIDLYANKNNLPDWGGGARGYYAGLIIWSFDHQAEERPTDMDSFRPVLKHELVHVTESLLKGRFVGDLAGDDPRRMPVWFSEGMAEALSGGTLTAVSTLDGMNELTAEYGTISPISYKLDFPVSDANTVKVAYYYYPMSHLAVEYLIDPAGLGKTPEDLARIMLDMADDVSFATAFETHMGISISDYESQFFALMGDYLPQSDTSMPVAAISLGLFSLVAAGLVVGDLIWGLQRRRATASATISTEAAVPSQGSRRGFVTEISAAAIVVIGFFVWVWSAIATANGPSDAEKVWGFATMVVYLIASIAILMWSVRRWAHHGRHAYLIPLLVLAATGLTIVTVGLIF